jgi:hypothetical protein
MEIPLTQGQVAIVDDADYVRLSQWKWFARKDRNTYYAHRNDGKRIVYMHRAIAGVSDSKVHIDHIDGNGLNNCRSNLRTATYAQNGRNHRIHRNNSTGFIGVSFYENKWVARITVAHKIIYLGCFENAVAAARARDSAALTMHGEFARLNFPHTTSPDRTPGCYQHENGNVNG